MSLVSKVSKILSFGVVDIVWDNFWFCFIYLFFMLAISYLDLLPFHSVCSRELGKKIWKARWNYSCCAHSRVPRQDIGECAHDSRILHTLSALFRLRPSRLSWQVVINLTVIIWLVCALYLSLSLHSKNGVRILL